MRTWVFDSLTKQYKDPFAEGILSVKATQTRNGFSGPEKLISWGGDGYYSEAIKNASFTFNFFNRKIKFSQYKMRSFKHSCTPYWWVVEGSNDGKEFFTIDLKEKALCNVKSCSSFCEETFEVSNMAPCSFVRVVSLKGECDGAFLYFGLNAIDFYGSLSYIYSFNKNQRVFLKSLSMFCLIQFLQKQ